MKLMFTLDDEGNYESVAKKCCENPEQVVTVVSALHGDLVNAHRQRDYLAELLETVCKNGSDGKCKLFYRCPALKYELSCGKITAGDWKHIAYRETIND